MTIEKTSYAVMLDAKDVRIDPQQHGVNFLPAIKALAGANSRMQRVVISTAMGTLTTYVGNLEEYAKGLTSDDLRATEDFIENQG